MDVKYYSFNEREVYSNRLNLIQLQKYNNMKIHFFFFLQYLISYYLMI